MKTNKTQTTTTQQLKINKSFRSLTKQEEEAKKAFMKYHPMENNPSLKVDDEYKKRLSSLLGVEVV